MQPIYMNLTFTNIRKAKTNEFHQILQDNSPANGHRTGFKSKLFEMILIEELCSSKDSINRVL